MGFKNFFLDLLANGENKLLDISTRFVPNHLHNQLCQNVSTVAQILYPVTVI